MKKVVFFSFVVLFLALIQCTELNCQTNDKDMNWEGLTKKFRDFFSHFFHLFPTFLGLKSCSPT